MANARSTEGLPRRHVLGGIGGAVLSAGLVIDGRAEAAPKVSKASQEAAYKNLRLVSSAYGGHDIAALAQELGMQAAQPAWKSKMSPQEDWSRKHALQFARFRSCIWRNDLGNAEAALAALPPRSHPLPPDAGFWETPEALEIARIEVALRSPERRAVDPATAARLGELGHDASMPPGIRFDALRALYLTTFPSNDLHGERSLLLELMDIATDPTFGWRPQIGLAFAQASRFYARTGVFDRAGAFAQEAFNAFRKTSPGPTLGTLEAQLAGAEFFVANAFEQRREESDDRKRTEAILKQLDEVLVNIESSLKLLPTVGPETAARIELIKLSVKVLPSAPWMSKVEDMISDGPWKDEAADIAAKLGALSTQMSKLGLSYEAARCQHLKYRAALVSGDPEQALVEGAKALQIAQAALNPGDFRMLEFYNHQIFILISKLASEERPSPAQKAELRALFTAAAAVIDTSLWSFFRGSTFLEKANFATCANIQLFTSLVALDGGSARERYDLILKIKGRLHQAVRLECAALRSGAIPAEVVDKLHRYSDSVVKRIYLDDEGKDDTQLLETTWEAHFRIDRGWRQVSEEGLAPANVPKVALLADLQRELKKDEVVIDFIRLDFPRVGDAIIAFVYGATGEPQIAELGVTDEIGPFSAIQRNLLEDTLSKESRERFDEHSWFMTKMLWWPLSSAIDKISTSASLLYIVPTRELAAFPFHSLVDAKGVYLGEKYAFSFLFSPYDLVRPLRKPGSAAGALLVGNVDYGAKDNFRWFGSNDSASPSNLELAPLRTTEIEKIRAIYKVERPTLPVETLEAEFAKEKTVCEKFRGAKIIHLSTHGFIRTAQPMNRLLSTGSGIQYYVNGIKVRPDAEVSPFISYGLGMMGANRREENLPSAGYSTTISGVLTASKIMLTDAEGTELVVLSACNAAVGQYYSNEVMIGLAPAFDFAGARGVVATLTPVNVAATSLLVEFLHKEIASGLAPARALSAAIRKLRASKIESFSLDSPMYWAPFVVFGRQNSLF